MTIEILRNLDHFGAVTSYKLNTRNFRSVDDALDYFGFDRDDEIILVDGPRAAVRQVGGFDPDRF